jgi:hypothetical protein
MRGRGRLVVVMNRDERHGRPPAQRPRRWPGAAGGFVAPVDTAAGGTWIAARADGLVLALLNHQPAGAAKDTGRAGRVSRGQLVTTLAAVAGLPDAARVRACGLDRFAPFRLLVVGRSTPPRVFTWNGVRLAARRLDARLGFVTSSSWNARAVLPARHRRFRAFTRDHGGAPSRAALEAFHARTDDPLGAPYAICMRRDDARTVSTTIVDAGPAGVVMRYRSR